VVSGAGTTTLERAVAALVGNVLHVDISDFDAHFFSLGGDSLSAIEMLAHLQEAFLVEVPPETLFSTDASVRAIARAIERARAEGDRREATSGARHPTAVARDGLLPLAPSQERVWFIEQVEPGLPTYNHAQLLWLRGALDIEALERAVAALVARHEALRTAIVHENGRLAQEVCDGALKLARHDVSGEGEPRTNDALAIARDDARRPFDLSSGELMRASLITVGADEHLLGVTSHFVAADGVSRGVMLRDLAALYRAEAIGEPASLPALAVQFADVAVWQKQQIQSGALDLDRTYWRERFSQLPPVVALASDRSRPPVRTRQGGRISFELPEPLTRAVRDVARESGSTLFMTLLAAFAVLLHRMGGQDDIVIGTPTGARGEASLGGVVGCITNSLALRADLSGDPTFAELLQRVRASCLDAFAHQALPFDQVVSDVRPDRSLAYDPLFQVFFGLRPPSREALDFGALEVSVDDLHLGTSKFDLDVQIDGIGGTLRGTVEFNADLFDATTVERLIDSYEVLLGAAVADIASPISSLPLMSATVRQQLLDLSTGAPSGATTDTIVDVVQRQVRATPDAIALEWRDERWSYARLDAAAHRLAAELREHGVAPETRVGVLMERSPAMVVAVLATLYAGGAYVPLDPAYPAARLEYMLDDVGALLVVTSEHRRAMVPGSVRVLVVDGELLAKDATADSARVALASTLAPEHAAYVLYTSGSTGRPKGVVIEHRNTVDFVRWGCRHYSREELARVLFSTSLNFDLSVFELFVPLACGGTVVLVDDALALTDAAKAPDVTLVNTVPSVLSEVLRAGPLPLSVQTINVCGEPLTAELAATVHALPGHQRLVNLYGPTEATTYATVVDIGTDDAGTPPIGRPRPNLRAFVLDERRRMVPFGVPGELHLGGAALARGYHGRPELTTERFVDVVFEGGSVERLYRTGDLARWRADGQLEFLGRLDHQVKVRGHRVELGEIDAALLAHPDVAGAVTIANDVPGGGRRLDAFVVPLVPGRGTAVLRDHLASLLPDYMVPATITELDRLPQTPNGKIDRTALVPAPATPARTAANAARTPIEEALVGIFANVLAVDDVGVDDDFFDVGGHSLLAVQLMSEIDALFSVPLPLRLLVEHATPSGLAELIRTALAPAAPPAFTYRVKDGTGEALFCLLVWLRGIPEFRRLAGHLDTTRPVHSVLAQHIADDAPPMQRVEDMAALAVQRLRAVQPSGPYTLVGFSLGAVVALEAAQQLVASGCDVSQLVLIDAALRPTPARWYTRWARTATHSSPSESLAAARRVVRRHVPLRVAARERSDLGVTDQLWTLDAANHRAWLRYEPRPWAGDALLVRTDASDRDRGGDAMGWERVVRGRLQIEIVPGEHRLVLSEPNVRAVADAISRMIRGD